MTRRLESGRHELATLAASLNALSPLGVLDRGYSLTKRLSDGTLIRAAKDLNVGDRISTLLANGSLVSQITEIDRDEA